MPEPEARPSIVVPPEPPRSRRGWIIAAVLLAVIVGVTVAVLLNRPSAEEQAFRAGIEAAWDKRTVDQQIEMCEDVRELGAATVVRLMLDYDDDPRESIVIDFFEEVCS